MSEQSAEEASESSYRSGIITEIIQQNYRWRVRFGATYWFAESKSLLALKPGDVVRVVGKENITTLLVEPV